MDSNHTFLWSKFETQTKTLFNNLITDTDFLDVTLVTDDGKQIKAHKVILSASSPFFRHVLSSNPHQHPLLYLKGISSSSLGSILEFIYLGEVNIALEHLDYFIQASEDLKIIGMLDVNQESITREEISEQRPKRRRVEHLESYTENDCEDQEQVNLCDDIANIQAIINIEQEEHIEVEADEADEDEEDDEDDDIVEIIQSPEICETNEEPEILFCDKCEFETTNNTSYAGHIKNEHSNDIPCKECKFQAKDNAVLKEHMLIDHQGLPCNNCNKRFSDLTFLRKHVLDTPDCSANILK